MAERSDAMSERQAAEGVRITLIGTAVNAVLVVAKMLAGLFGHSQAMIADAVHSLSDLVTDIIVLVGLRVGRRPPDHNHPYGHGRIETLASAGVGIALVAAAIYLGTSAALDIYSHRQSNPNVLAVAGAALSIISKEALYRYTVAVGRQIRSTAVVANAWHHRSDALSSVAVLVGLVAALIDPRLRILDAYAAGLVALLIAKVGFDITWTSLREMVDTSPGVEVVDAIRRSIEAVGGVRQAHDLRVRAVGGLHIVQVHIVVDGTLTVSEGHAIAEAVESALREQHPDVGDVTVHVDPHDAVDIA